MQVSKDSHTFYCKLWPSDTMSDFFLFSFNFIGWRCSHLNAQISSSQLHIHNALCSVVLVCVPTNSRKKKSLCLNIWMTDALGNYFWFYFFPSVPHPTAGFFSLPFPLLFLKFFPFFTFSLLSIIAIFYNSFYVLTDLF